MIHYLWPDITWYTTCDQISHNTLCMTRYHMIHYLWPDITWYTTCGQISHDTLLVTRYHTFLHQIIASGQSFWCATMAGMNAPPMSIFQTTGYIPLHHHNVYFSMCTFSKPSNRLLAGSQNVRELFFKLALKMEKRVNIIQLAWQTQCNQCWLSIGLSQKRRDSVHTNKASITISTVHIVPAYCIIINACHASQTCKFTLFLQIIFSANIILERRGPSHIYTSFACHEYMIKIAVCPHMVMASDRGEKGRQPFLGGGNTTATGKYRGTMHGRRNGSESQWLNTSQIWSVTVRWVLSGNTVKLTLVPLSRISQL